MNLKLASKIPRFEQQDYLLKLTKDLIYAKEAIKIQSFSNFLTLQITFETTYVTLEDITTLITCHARMCIQVAGGHFE